MDLLDTHVYARIGEEGFSRLVAAFFRRVPGDDILSAMYPEHDLAGAEQRLRGFLIQRFGGPDTYSQQRGHPRLRMRHAPFAIDQRARDRWVSLMEAAMFEVDLPADVHPPLRRFFHEGATFMMNRGSPNDETGMTNQ
jgi:hemoglobin